MKFSLAILLAVVGTTEAVLTFTLREDGPNLVLDVVGTFNTVGAGFFAANSICNPATFTSFEVNNCSAFKDFYRPVSGPTSFSDPAAFPGIVFPGVADSSVADPANEAVISPPQPGGTIFGVPVGYVSGTPISSIAGATWNGESLASLNVNAGDSATWTFANGETVVVEFAAAASATGDPHFVRFGHIHHDSFHGECDLLLLSSKVLDVHLRTTIRRDSYSYIDKVAIKIGSHVVEADPKHMFLDGKELDFRDKKNFPYDIGLMESPDGSGEMNKITLKKLSKKKFRITWGTGGHVEFRAVGIYMGVSVDGSSIDFGDAVGMMGHYGTGEMLDRQGNPMEDMDAFGMEWQIKEEDPILFLEKRAPQWPEEKCRMPTAAGRRNLRENTKLGEEAEKACAGVVDFDMCVNDIMLTGDVELAEFF